MKTDSQLQLDVLDELKWDPSVHHEAIGAAVNDGVVMLSGYVKSYAEKLNAEKAARRVKGVKAIAEELTVRYDYQPKTGDSEIARRISDVQVATKAPTERVFRRLGAGLTMRLHAVCTCEPQMPGRTPLMHRNR